MRRPCRECSDSGRKSFDRGAQGTLTEPNSYSKNGSGDQEVSDSEYASSLINTASGAEDGGASDASGKRTSAKSEFEQQKYGKHLNVPGPHRQRLHRQPSDTESRYGDDEDSDSDGSGREGGYPLPRSLVETCSQEKAMSEAGSFFVTLPPKN